MKGAWKEMQSTKKKNYMCADCHAISVPENLASVCILPGTRPEQSAHLLPDPWTRHDRHFCICVVWL